MSEKCDLHYANPSVFVKGLRGEFVFAAFNNYYIYILIKVKSDCPLYQAMTAMGRLAHSSAMTMMTCKSNHAM